MLILHSDAVWCDSYYWDVLLLEWQGPLAYRSGVLKFRFSSSEHEEVLNNMNLAKMSFALA